jgi:hypothetical protein
VLAALGDGLPQRPARSPLDLREVPTAHRRVDGVARSVEVVG